MIEYECEFKEGDLVELVPEELEDVGYICMPHTPFRVVSVIKSTEKKFPRILLDGFLFGRRIIKCDVSYAELMVSDSAITPYVEPKVSIDNML